MFALLFLQSVLAFGVHPRHTVDGNVHGLGRSSAKKMQQGFGPYSKMQPYRAHTMPYRAHTMPYWAHTMPYWWYDEQAQCEPRQAQHASEKAADERSTIEKEARAQRANDKAPTADERSTSEKEARAQRANDEADDAFTPTNGWQEIPVMPEGLEFQVDLQTGKRLFRLEEPQCEVVTPTNEWQEIPVGAVMPAGLEYRINLQTGKKHFRLLQRS